MNDSTRTFYYKQASIGALIFLAYLVTARIGLMVHPVNTFATLIWPPTGIALASFVLYGYRFFPAVAIAAFVVNFSIGASTMVALSIAIGNTIAPLIGAYVLIEYIGFKPSILRLRDNIGLVVIAMSVTLISATIGATSLWLGGSVPAGTFATTWSTWWIGDILGILIFAPLMFKWISWPLYERTRLQHIEMYTVLTAVAATTFMTFWVQQTHFAYYIFIPLTWAALRTGPRGTTLAVFIAATIATTGTLLGYGPFVTQGLSYLQIFFGTLSALFLIFAAVVEDRRQALRTLEGHVDNLEKALRRISLEDEAKTKFLAVLAHELRNPLAAVLSSVELLKMQGHQTQDAPELLQTIDEHVRVMANLLDDLLDVSRISREKLKLKRETVSLNDVLERSARTAQVLVLRREHTLTVNKLSQDVLLDADPVRLEQIILNLLSNASKYTDIQGAISLTAEREGKMALIRVRDNGIGIPHTLLARIFEPFFQVERGQTISEGLGIGLSLTKQLVEMHDGTIEARSNGEGQGSEFIVRLPIPARLQQPAPSAGKKNTPQPRRSSHGLKVLVVDDNAGVTNAIGQLLTLRGHQVGLAYTGSEALEKARHMHPDVAIVDIGLPDIDGYEVARTIRKQKDFAPVLVALTGYGQAHDKEEARKAGFDKHLTKPAGFREIETIVREVARKKAAQ